MLEAAGGEAVGVSKRETIVRRATLKVFGAYSLLMPQKSGKKVKKWTNETIKVSDPLQFFDFFISIFQNASQEFSGNFGEL